jgi:hypothetical protein
MFVMKSFQARRGIPNGDKSLLEKLFKTLTHPNMARSGAWSNMS